MRRVYNFCAGPCTLPLAVLEEVQTEFLDFQGSGMSIIEHSHRGAEYDAVHEESLALFRELFAVPDEFEILFLQGGGILAFSMVPMNLLKAGEQAGYVRSGTWGVGAEKDAAFYGSVYTAWDGKPHAYSRMPNPEEIELRPGTRYLHITSNETIEGVRFVDFPRLGVPLIADMSSDYLSRAIPWELFDLVYGGAQKNLGPAGLAIVVVRRSVLESSNRQLGSYLRFDLQAEKRSLLNTPPMFPIYTMGKVLKWMKAAGGVAEMQRRADRRSGQVYRVIDESNGFYNAPVEPAHRSVMNVVFRLPSDELDAAFLKGGEGAGFVNLKGHRSVGGMRASIYNAMPDEGVDALTHYMGEFATRHG